MPDAPRIVTDPPGPRSRELLDRGARTLYRGLAGDLAPLVVARKDGHTVTDVDGNVYLDLASASASVPLGAGRADLIEPAVEWIRRIGNEDSHALASEGMFELADRLIAIAPAGRSRASTSPSTAPRRSRRRSG